MACAKIAKDDDDDDDKDYDDDDDDDLFARLRKSGNGRSRPVATPRVHAAENKGMRGSAGQRLSAGVHLAMSERLA